MIITSVVHIQPFLFFTETKIRRSLQTNHFQCCIIFKIIFISATLRYADFAESPYRGTLSSVWLQFNSALEHLSADSWKVDKISDQIFKIEKARHGKLFGANKMDLLLSLVNDIPNDQTINILQYWICPTELSTFPGM